MTKLEWPEDLRHVVVKLEKLHRIARRRNGSSGWSTPEALKARIADALPREIRRLATRLEREPPDELVMFASLKSPSLFDYGLDGVARLALVEQHPELEDDRWTAVARLRPFWLIEMELDGSSDLPEISELEVSSPEALEAPSWILELALERDEYRLVGRPEHAYEGDLTILSRGSLAGVMQFAIDAQLDRLPSIVKEMAELDIGAFEVPAVEVAAPEPEENDQHVGLAVSHSKFGSGTVVKRLPGKNEKFLVEFDEHGTRKLLGQFLDFE